jgi:hypothetical protein
VTDASNITESAESEKAVAGQSIVARATTRALDPKVRRYDGHKGLQSRRGLLRVRAALIRNSSRYFFKIMKTAVAGVLLASSAALLTGCAAYPDASGYGGGYASPVYDEPGYGYYGAPVAQPNVVFGSGYYYGPGPGRYWDEGPGWRGRPPGYWHGDQSPNRGWRNGPPPNGQHGGPPPQAGGGRPPAGGSPGGPPPQAGGGQVPQSVGGVRPRPPAAAAPAPAPNNGGGGGGGGRSRGGAPANGTVQPLQH